MQETNNSSPARPTRRRTGIAITIVIAAVTAVALLTIRDHGGEPASAAPPTTAATDVPTPTTAPTGSTTPPTGVARPVSSTPPVVPTAPEPAPAEPVMADGRHPVFLTDIDVDGGTVEFDLLQHLTGAEEEVYEAAHPNEYADAGDYDHSPLHNDNPRLRRLPVANNARVFVQTMTAGCDGPHAIAFAALPAYFNNVNSYETSSGHLGARSFWLTVNNDTVTDIEEMQCAG
jgi:hypothetical protein